jgi:hypothetical protein
MKIWKMFAHERNGEIIGVESNRRTAKKYAGDSPLIEVDVIADEYGEYRGWIETEEDVPIMIRKRNPIGRQCLDSTGRWLLTPSSISLRVIRGGEAMERQQ